MILPEVVEVMLVNDASCMTQLVGLTRNNEVESG